MMIFKMSSYAPFDFLGKVPKNGDFQNGRCQFETNIICSAILTNIKSFSLILAWLFHF